MFQPNPAGIEQQAQTELIQLLAQIAQLDEQRDITTKRVAEARAIIQGIKIGRETAAQQAAQEAPSE